MSIESPKKPVQLLEEQRRNIRPQKDEAGKIEDIRRLSMYKGKSPEKIEIEIRESARKASEDEKLRRSGFYKGKK